MLNNRNLDDKTYEELMAEALMQIPLYSEEWTNYNPSDPGITILESLTAFEYLQQNQLNQITPLIQQRLLKLAGFEANRGKCAKVLLEARNVTEPLHISANQKFILDDLCFETVKNMTLPSCRLTGVYSKSEDKFTDCSWLLDREVSIPAYVFTDNPAVGCSLWITADSLPEPSEEIIFYMEAANRHNRNPFIGKGNNTFATLKWECYTEQGFVEMNVRDATGCFLISGDVRMRLPQIPAAPCPDAPNGDYAIRITLERADYDICPKMVMISGFLLEAWQKETKVAGYTFNRISSVAITNDLLDAGYVRVFCKEEKGSSYRLYEPDNLSGEQGRFYEWNWEGRGKCTWTFDKSRFGYGPEKVRNAVKIVVYNEEMMRKYSLGTVLGYDNQMIDLPAENIVSDSFCIIVKRQNKFGEDIYNFVRPNRFEEDALTYRLYEKEGKIVIEDAGEYIGAEMYLGSLSVTLGPEGNVRQGNDFEAIGLPKAIRFFNPEAGKGGCFHESIEQVKRRFLEDLKKSYTAVTAADYEELVRETPELCIDKVKAYMNENRNVVRIVVKPGTDEPFPRLSKPYRKCIEKQLEDKRLLCTRIELDQPVYAGIDVHATISVKKQFENSREMIEIAVKKKLDSIYAAKNFGEVLRFEEVFREIESLECVECVYDLALHSQNPAAAHVVDSDIITEMNVLCYGGDISLQIGYYQRG